MKFGALLPARPQYLAAAPGLESVGFTELWFPDFQLVGADPFLTMAQVGPQLTSARMGVAVCNPVTRHPTVVANMMASLNRLYPGRLGLGIGAGASPLKALGLPSATISELTSFVTACRELLQGRPAAVGANDLRVGFLGVSGSALNTDDSVTIRIAAGGPKSLRAAGAIADEVILGTIEPVLVETAIAQIRAGACDAGRDPSSIGVAVLAAAYGGSDDPELREVISHVGGYVPNMLVSNYRLAGLAADRLPVGLASAFAEVRRILKGDATDPKRGDPSQRYEKYMEAIPDVYRHLVTARTVAAKVFYGGPQRFRAHCDVLEDLGVTTVVLFPDPQADDSLARIGAEWISAAARPAEVRKGTQAYG